jgi:hypothetical protein
VKVKDEIYFKKRNEKLMKRDPIKFMAYVANEMTKIAVHENNKRQQEFYAALSFIAKKYL